jgi:hypothetical protein
MTKTKVTLKSNIKEKKIVKDNLIDIEKLEIDNLPDGVKVATMCSSCFLGTKLDLDNIEDQSGIAFTPNKDGYFRVVEVEEFEK